MARSCAGCGRGWSAEDFAAALRTRRRGRLGLSRFAAASPAAPNGSWRRCRTTRFAKALEVGCAQGFLTERLAARVERLIACDISAEAMRQARENCRGFAMSNFASPTSAVGFPGDGFDLCLFSDVLYYLSARETDAVLAEAAQKIDARRDPADRQRVGAGARGPDAADLRVRAARRRCRVGAPRSSCRAPLAKPNCRWDLSPAGAGRVQNGPALARSPQISPR